MFSRRTITAMAVCLLSVSCICAAAFAASEKTVSGEEMSMRVRITGHERGTIYKVTTADGRELRMDVGKHGGRMLNRHFFTAKGEMKTDDKGEYFKMKTVQYKDPVVRIQQESEKMPKTIENSAKIDSERDVAYFHDNPVSDQNRFYQNNVANVTDTSIYQAVELEEIKGLAEGTKISIIVRPIKTIEKDTLIEFWNIRNAKVNVHMNGAYVPMGQRCTIYGTVMGDGSVSLERMDSVAESA
ncbi:MAG: hypothetical protein IJV46_10170 [Acidaminococcaceae bacterium]|nr:hypothetical protein [Acidaminococcaceae bacterium]